MIKIITDSSSNITPEEAYKMGVTVLPLTINFGGKEFADGIDISAEQFYAKLAEGREFPHTSQLCEEQIERAYRQALKEADEVLVLPIASSLSGSYERAAKVAERFDNVHVYDLCCTTVMLKMLVTEAVANAGKPAAEIAEILKAYRKKIKLYAALDTLEYLRKGGRLSGASALIGTMLKIKPVISINAEGKVEMLSKQFGTGKALDFVAGMVDEKKIDFSRPVYQIYTMDAAHSDKLFEKLKIIPSDRDNICPVIGTHIGPRAAGVVFAEK